MDSIEGWDLMLFYGLRNDSISMGAFMGANYGALFLRDAVVMLGRLIFDLLL